MTGVKRYLSRLVLLAGSIGMTLIANLAAVVYALAGSDRAWPVVVANDQALNAAIVGQPGSEDESISSRAGKAARKGRQWGCLLCKLLDYVDPSHCEKNIEDDEGEKSCP